MTNPSPEPAASPAGEATDRIIQGHKYDGIREYDNPMPGWWLWLLWATVLFSVVYLFGIYVFDFVDTYQEDLAESQQELQQIRHAYSEANPIFEVDEATLAGYVGNASMIEAGAAHYAAQCATCHGNEGQGLIGPNLADAYWIHGGSNVAVFTIISEGVVAQGMPPWQGVFTPEERAELVAFVHSLQGTDPPNAKEPQGELVE